MLSKEQRKLLLEHNWYYFLKEESNPSQSRRRIIDNASRCIRDLKLLAYKLPDKEFQEIFNEDIMKSLLMAIFFVTSGRDGKDQPFHAELAPLFVTIAVTACMVKYESFNRDYPRTAQPVMDYLNKTIDICKEIGYRTKLEKFEKEARKKNQQYICTLEEIQHSGPSNFSDYIRDELNLEPLFRRTIETVDHDVNRKEITIKLYYPDSPEDEEEHYDTITMDIHFDKKICNLKCDHLEGNSINKKLIVEEYGDNNYAFFKKNN